jgi:nucleoside-diphosphate-sugar epimerase
VRRAVVLAGTGAIGWATTRRLIGAGWSVTVTGRDPAGVPTGLAALGAQFLQADRHEPTSLPIAIGSGADLLVDCACHTVADAGGLLPLLGDVSSTVMISSKAVYVDGEGRHSNSDEPPQFEAPITEDHATLRPTNDHYDSREGYGPNKVAAEEVLLSSTHPVTVLRPSKIHGTWSRQPREWFFVKRALDQRPVVLLARGGAGADHPSAALNIAALIETVADQPGRRILNAADPDCPNGGTIAAIIADYLGHTCRQILLDEAAPEGLGTHPWNRVPPITLDTTAARALGYTPVGDYRTTVTEELDWLVTNATGGRVHQLPPPWDTGSVPLTYSYAEEDSYVELHAG